MNERAPRPRKASSVVRLAGRGIGDGEPCFITFEAGATHDGLDTAKALVRHAAMAGADAVKFQIFDPDRLVADKKQPFTYEVLADRVTGRTETVCEPLYDILTRRCMTASEWSEVKTLCDSLKLRFFATVGFEEDLKLLEKLGCDSVKIASADVNHLPLLRLAAQSGMTVQIDTGNATIGEVEQAVDILLEEGTPNIIIHNCPSGYPARLESINLRFIPTLKRIFGCPVAFSDHTPGRDIDIAAVALGANMLEKTVTLDRTTRSVEHVFSLEPEEMSQFIQAIREVEIALGESRRIVQPAEKAKYQAYRRSAFTRRDVRPGESLGPESVEYRRPGHGIGPDVLEWLGPRRFARELPAGTMITLEDLAAPEQAE